MYKVFSSVHIRLNENSECNTATLSDAQHHNISCESQKRVACSSIKLHLIRNTLEAQTEIFWCLNKSITSVTN